MSNVLTFRQRKDLGTEHEERVRPELERRGWTVYRIGFEGWPKAVQFAMKRSASSFNSMPEYLIACGSRAMFVDCKTRFPGNTRHSVSRKAIHAHLKLFAEYEVPVYYVFEDLGVLTPAEVMQKARVESLATSDPYLLVESADCRPFDTVFGSARESSWSALPLTNVRAA